MLSGLVLVCLLVPGTAQAAERLRVDVEVRAPDLAFEPGRARVTPTYVLLRTQEAVSPMRIVMIEDR